MFSRAITGRGLCHHAPVGITRGQGSDANRAFHVEKFSSVTCAHHEETSLLTTVAHTQQRNSSNHLPTAHLVIRIWGTKCREVTRRYAFTVQNIQKNLLANNSPLSQRKFSKYTFPLGKFKRSGGQTSRGCGGLGPVESIVLFQRFTTLKLDSLQVYVLRDTLFSSSFH